MALAYPDRHTLKALRELRADLDSRPIEALSTGLGLGTYQLRQPAPVESLFTPPALSKANSFQVSRSLKPGSKPKTKQNILSLSNLFWDFVAFACLLLLSALSIRLWLGPRSLNEGLEVLKGLGILPIAVFGSSFFLSLHGFRQLILRAGSKTEPKLSKASASQKEQRELQSFKAVP